MKAPIIPHATGGPAQAAIMEMDSRGYDRFRIDGTVMGSVCRFWKRGEWEASVQGTGTTVEIAILDALAFVKGMESLDAYKPE